MGSSASIMQANINAGDNRNSTITFHCQELRENNMAHSRSVKPVVFAITDTVKSGLTVQQGALASGKANIRGSEVTRYFPIIQPPSSISTVGAMESVPPYIDKPVDKDRGTKENYYYSCEICSKGFMFKGSLNRHLARHLQTGKDMEEIAMIPRTYPINVKSSGIVTEVRYQLKDPRLYEQHHKLEKLKGVQAETRLKKPSSNRKPKVCSACKAVGHTAATCGAFPRGNLMISRDGAMARDHALLMGKNVLAICSCLKCNRSFDDVDKLKDHIPTCQGLAAKHLHQSEVR